MSNKTPESAAAAFIEEHEILKRDLKIMMDEHHSQREQIADLHNRVGMQQEENERLREEKDRYLKFAIELASQLQFIIGGAGRALRIAQRISAAVHADLEPIPGADIDELERIINNLPGGDTPQNDAMKNRAKRLKVEPAEKIMQPIIDAATRNMNYVRSGPTVYDKNAGELVTPIIPADMISDGPLKARAILDPVNNGFTMPEDATFSRASTINTFATGAKPNPSPEAVEKAFSPDVEAIIPLKRNLNGNVSRASSSMTSILPPNRF